MGNLTTVDRAPSPQSVPAASMTADEDNLDKLPLVRTSVIIAIVMLLKAHLKSLYSLSEEYVTYVEIYAQADSFFRKCNKFVIGKKSAMGDKPATRRYDTPITWDRLPYATTPLFTTEDLKNQKARVRLYFFLFGPNHKPVPYSSWKFGMKMASPPNPKMNWTLPDSLLQIVQITNNTSWSLLHACLNRITDIPFIINTNYRLIVEGIW